MFLNASVTNRILRCIRPVSQSHNHARVIDANTQADETLYSRWADRRGKGDILTRLRLLTLICYVLLIFFVSTRTNVHPPGPDFPLKDKLAHFAEYFVLGILLFGGIGWTVSRSKAATFLFLFAVGVSVAALDELLQSYIPERTMDIYDWIADAAGVAAGVGLCVAIGVGRRFRGPRAVGGETTD